MLNLKLKIARPTDPTLSFFCGTLTQALLIAVVGTINACVATGSAPPGEQESWKYDSIEFQMSRSEVDAAIALGNLSALGRIDKASRLNALYDAMIETERARIVLRESLARRRMAAKQRAEAIKVSLAANSANGSPDAGTGDADTGTDPSLTGTDPAVSLTGTDPVAAESVQVTTYQESELTANSAIGMPGTGAGAKLLRPTKKYSLVGPHLNSRREQHRGYKPLVVSRPRTDYIVSESDHPATKIDIAKSANLRHSEPLEKTEPRPVAEESGTRPVVAHNPILAAGGAVADTQSQLESVVVDNFPADKLLADNLLADKLLVEKLLVEKQTPETVANDEKSLALPQPPPLPQPPQRPPSARQPAAVAVAEVPTDAITRPAPESPAPESPAPESPATEPVAGAQGTEPLLAAMLDSELPSTFLAEPVTMKTDAPPSPAKSPSPQPDAVIAGHRTATADPLRRGAQVRAMTIGHQLAHHPVAVNSRNPSNTPTPQAATPPEAARAPEATVAMQWPFTRGQSEELPTPQNGSDVTLNVDDVDVRTVLEMLAKSYGMNILVAPDVEGFVTANVSGLTPEQTLNSVVRMCGLAVQREDNVILVYPRDNLPRESRQLRVFQLDFARAELIEPTVTGLLSSIGSAYSSTVDELDNRKGREAIVVIDTPEVLTQVESYIMQADQPPRQVMIEARVLEIELRDDMEHGVNFEALLGGDFRVGGFRLTDNIATSNNPFFFAEIDSTRLDALITMLETTTDAKTLATPRVMVVNGQNAKIQVGQQLGFAVATVTQTSTIQDVRYLDTGVVLQVTPTISRDNRVLLSVKPKVSSGEINPDTLLPEETTREVETSVMLGNHQGMIIGGLIQEDDRVVIKKLPWLGDVKYVGKLFQRRETSRARTEIIVALIPHIVESCDQGHCEIDDPLRKQIEWERTENRLFNGPLNRECRPWEARLPDVTGETGFHRDIDRLRNIDPYGKGCEPIKTGLLSTD